MGQPNGYYTFKGQREDVLVRTANYTVEPYLYECGNFSNAGAAGAITVTLPPAMPGRTHTFHVEAAQLLNVLPASGEYVWDTTNNAYAAVDTLVRNNTIGNSITFECLAKGYWACKKHVGAWTVA